MRIRLEAVFVVALLSGVVAACGGGSDSAKVQDEPLGEQPSDSLPPIQTQPEASQEAEVPEEPTAPAETTAPVEPVAITYPLTGQTGWAAGEIETRDPLGLVKMGACAARATKESVPMPASSVQCTGTFPGLVSGGEARYVARLPSGTVTESREGCTLVDEGTGPTLLCGWTYSVASAPPFTSMVDYWLHVSFVPTFSPLITACEAGEDHWLGALAVRGGGGTAPVVKAPVVYPVGCSDWDALKSVFEAFPLRFQSNAG